MKTIVTTEYLEKTREVEELQDLIVKALIKSHYPLTVRNYVILETIYSEPGITRSQIRSKVGIKHLNTHFRIRELEKQGFIIRGESREFDPTKPGPGESWYRVTPQGRDAVQAASSYLNSIGES